MSWRSSSGLRAWVIQRFSAVYMLVFVLFCMVSFSLSQPFNYHEWKSWIASPINNTATALFFIALLMHAWVGLRDVVMDYVKPFAFRFLLLIGIATLLVAMGLWVLRILTSIAI